MTPQKLLIKWRERGASDQEQPISLRAAAKLLKAAPSTICKFETGERTPNLLQSYLIQLHAGISPDSWLPKDWDK